MLGICLVLVAGVGVIFGRNILTSHDTTPAEAYDWSRDKVYDTLAKGLKDKDEAEFLRPFEGEQAKDRAQKLYRNLVKVPFKQARFEDLAAGGQGGMPVAFVHQIEGIDVAPVYEQYTFTFAQKPSHEQYITGFEGATEPFQGLPGTFYPAPWDVYEDMTVVRQGRVLIVADRKHQEDTERFAPYISRAADEDVQAWERSGADQTQVSKGAVIVLEPEREVYEKFYRGPDDHDSLEAGANMALPKHQAKYEDKVQYGGSRIVMDSSLSRFTSPSWREGVAEISRHEIGHAMVAPYNSARGALPVYPDAWVSEGFAGYMEARADPKKARRDALWSLRGHPFGSWYRPQDDVEAFYDKDAKERHANYVFSRLTFQYMARKYGEEATFGFVAAEYADPVKQREHFRKYLGVSRSDFWDAWYRFVLSEIPGMRLSD
ncbi:hypothetical protein [Streptomyces sp. NPDC003077]|uniref:hypothetical protein n=1 Tax=Streptomyces sp. NPDC003077 TaxID=3154443 RepID=UPI0033B805E1